MMFADPARSRPPRMLERLHHWQGQKLLGRDFRDQLAYDAELRHWHNRALHTSGVREGLEVDHTPAGPPSVLRVEPGLAYDCFGRPVVLEEAREVEVPECTSHGEPVWCLLLIRPAPEGSGAGLAPAELAWERESCVEPSHGVPLARAGRRGDRVRLEAGPRRPSRPLARPRLARGATTPGTTPWERWDRGPRGTWLGLQVRVDTSAGGFTRVPCYFAWLQAQSWSGGSDATFPMPLDGRFVAEETPFGFRFRLVRAPGTTPAEMLDYAARASLFVCWVGLEGGPTSRTSPLAARRCC